MVVSVGGRPNPRPHPHAWGGVMVASVGAASSTWSCTHRNYLLPTSQGAQGHDSPPQHPSSEPFSCESHDCRNGSHASHVIVA